MYKSSRMPDRVEVCYSVVDFVQVYLQTKTYFRCAVRELAGNKAMSGVLSVIKEVISIS